MINCKCTNLEMIKDGMGFWKGWQCKYYKDKAQTFNCTNCIYFHKDMATLKQQREYRKKMGYSK